MENAAVFPNFTGTGTSLQKVKKITEVYTSAVNF